MEDLTEPLLPNNDDALPSIDNDLSRGDDTAAEEEEEGQVQIEEGGRVVEPREEQEGNADATREHEILESSSRSSLPQRFLHSIVSALQTPLLSEHYHHHPLWVHVRLFKFFAVTLLGICFTHVMVVSLVRTVHSVLVMDCSAHLPATEHSLIIISMTTIFSWSCLPGLGTPKGSHTS